MQVNGSTFIVTGGASGLGAAVTRMLTAGGGRVVIADLKEAEGQALATELGASAKFVRTDVTDEESGKAAVAAAATAFGGLHGLVNCAGIVHGEKVVGKEGPHTLAGFARTISINLVGMFNMIRLAADVMAKGAPNADGERGVIVCTASVAAFDGQIGQAAYSASKAGIVGDDAANRPRARPLRHSRHDDRARYFRDADDGSGAAGDRRVTGQDGAVSAAARPAARIRLARSRDHGQRDAERRSDPARRRDPHGAEMTRGQRIA